MSLLRQRRFLLIAGLATVICLVMLLAQVTADTLLADAFNIGPISIARGALEQSNAEQSPTNLENSVANCRYGITALNEEQISRVDDLGSGMFLDFRYDTLKYLRDNPTSNGAQYLPLITVKEDKDSNGNYLGTYSSYPTLVADEPNNDATLRYWLRRYPGLLWNIGNEIERGPDPGQTSSTQGDTHAEVYAQAYKEIRDFILRYDPTARTAFAALVEVTPLRLVYLDRAWQAHIDLYGHAPEVDAWAMHLYILPEATPSGNPNGIANIPLGTMDMIHLAKRESGGNPNLCPLDDVYCYAEHDDMGVFIEQITDMRVWMKQHGQQNKPLLLTEYSILYPYEVDGDSCFVQDEYGNCFVPERVQAFMDATLDYLDSAADLNLGYPLDGGRLVQQWVWFSVNHGFGAGSVSNLYNHAPGGALTTIRPLGQLYMDRINSIQTYVNLLSDGAGTIFASSDSTGSADVDIWATFRNNGTTHITEPFNVTFYANPALTQVIGTATVTPEPIVAGCAQMNYRASVTWEDLEPGIHKYWVAVDDDNDIGESNETDNRNRGIVFVDGELLHLPVAVRP